ncbi:DNA primase [Vulcanibacillus modesticaldus]|uniref:DNA primase n=1 Tax=Vulcanibacillus modesticaldus TaxID=337097 RepID=A0A1D2YVS9_9BACI|nr:DNA primase [Vulcanibacillus modesticaldus]OEF99736.1 DNA primase [Vulcanibacillus modesticaldus]
MSSKLIPDEYIERIRRHFDIVDVVGQFVPLKKSGRNFFGLCPFHSEKTPSFSVSPDKQIYHCFGCGAGGDVIRFIMDIESLDFREAVKYLANEAGMNIPQLDDTTSENVQDSYRNKVFQLYDLTTKLYHYLLLETEHGKNALNYLIKRGFSRDIIEKFNIGYSPSAWDTLQNFLTKRGFSLELIKQAGLVIETDEGRTYDRFRNRIIFPIFDAQGRVIAFGGRVLDDGHPKYLNSPETNIFNKSRTLYNLHLAKQEIRKRRQAILFEGYIDTISAWKAGVYNGVATLGTSLTVEQAKIIKRYADEVVISYDSDLAGQQATYRAIDILLPVGLSVKIAQIPQGLDPDDYIDKYGAESFKSNILGNSITATAFKLQYIRKDFNLKDEAGRLQYLTSALSIISELNHAIEREHYLKGLAEEFNLSFPSLKSDLDQIYYNKRNKKEYTKDNLTNEWNNIINNGNHVGRHKTLHPAYYNAEKYLIYLMMNSREIAEKVRQEIGSDFHVEDFSVLAAYLYSYYGKDYDSNISHFISTIEDKKYMQLATELALLEINENVTEEELNDYIFQVKKHFLELEIRKKQKEQLIAERNNDFAKSLQIGKEIIELRNRLKWGKK